MTIFPTPECLRINGRRVVVQRIDPPIPTRAYDFSAAWIDYEPGDPIGYGASALAALKDLKDQTMEGESNG